LFTMTLCWSSFGTAAADTGLLDRVRLTWSAPKACPGADSVKARMVRLLSRFAGAHPELVAEARVRPEPAGFRLEMRISQGEQSSSRTMHAASCRELSDAAALILALLVDPALQMPGDEVRSVPPPHARRLPHARTSSAERDRVIHVVPFAFSGVAVASGSVPGLAPGLTLGVAGELGRMSLELGALWLPLAKRIVLDDPTEPQKGGRFDLLTAEARLCRHFFRVPELRVCAASEVGSLRGAGFGTANDRSRRVLWSALGPALSGAVPLTSALALSLGAEALIALNRPEFELDNVGPVYRPAAVSLRARLSVLFYIP
jgi:hypothetical protein